MSKLDETRDFIELYVHHQGESEIPVHWHQWACVSLLAAAVADRVWVQRNENWRIYPNLYVFLIGPSGSGKDHAIKDIIDLANSSVDRHGNPSIRNFCGRPTREHFIDQMKDGEGGYNNPTLYFLAPELGSSLRAGDRGFELISFMTELYTKRVHDEGTRGLGHVRITNACLNWLAGTTDEWLTRSVPRDSIEGGFFARVLPVRGQRNYEKRCTEITLPADHQQIRYHLQLRLNQLTWLEGPFYLSEEAREAHDRWYQNMQLPENEKLLPSFNRADELVCRLSLVLKLAELERPPMEQPWRLEEPFIELKHFEKAVKMWEPLMKHDMVEVQKLAGASKESADVDLVARMIQRLKRIEHSVLLRRVSPYGLNAARLRPAVDTLIQRQEVEWDREERVYTWVG